MTRPEREPDQEKTVTIHEIGPGEIRISGAGGVDVPKTIVRDPAGTEEAIRTDAELKQAKAERQQVERDLQQARQLIVDGIAKAESLRQAASNNKVHSQHKGRAGPRDKYPWYELEDEQARLAKQPKGLISQDWVRTQLQNYITVNWPEPPDPSTVRRRFSKMIPRDIPEK